MQVLHEDNHLIAVNKLPGEIVQGDKTGDEPLSERVKAYIKQKYHKPGEVFLGTVHRLDRPVSGVVLFARTSKALERMNALFRDREITKIYWAVVVKPPQQPEGALQHFLIKNEQKNKSRAYDKPVKGALESVLKYRTLAVSDRYTLLQVSPLTGRHHQIRVQLAAIGCVIKGDLKYGAPRSNRDASIQLHARSIAFNHPVSGLPVQITAPVPAENLWQAFEKMVK